MISLFDFMLILSVLGASSTLLLACFAAWLWTRVVCLAQDVEVLRAERCALEKQISDYEMRKL